MNAEAETDQFVDQFLAWKARRGEPLADSSRKSYRTTLQKLAASKGSLRTVTRDQILDYLDAHRHQARSSLQRERVVFRQFFGFAERRIRPDNPAPSSIRVAKHRRQPGRWAFAPRRDALPLPFRPVFDFLREVWRYNPKLTFPEVLSIRTPGRVPEVVELRKGPRRGERILLSPMARGALEEMGGEVPFRARTIQRAFQNAYQGAFPPKDLKDLPPPGFGLELHPV